MKNTRKIRCECGQIVTVNTIIGHVRKPWCTAGVPYKKNIEEASALRSRVGNKAPYLIPATEESTMIRYWYGKVIRGEIPISSLTWGKTRAEKKARPSTLAKMSSERTGTGNPSVRRRLKDISFTKKDIKSEILRLYAVFLSDESLPFSYIDKSLKNKFKNYACLYTSDHGGSARNGSNQKKWKDEIFAKYLGITEERLTKIKRLRRGRMISAGQLASEKFLKMASDHGSKMTSTWRVTKPHSILYDMVLSLDPDASMEKRFNVDNRWKSFDIYSPAINALIEMHGRVWHDSSSCPAGLMPMCIKNEENDQIKRKFASDNGFKYEIFWDDEMAKWPERLNFLYGKKYT